MFPVFLACHGRERYLYVLHAYSISASFTALFLDRELWYVFRQLTWLSAIFVRVFGSLIEPVCCMFSLHPFSLSQGSQLLVRCRRAKGYGQQCTRVSPWLPQILRKPRTTLSAMKAIRYYGPGDMRLDDIPEPNPGPNQVKVKVNLR